MKHLNSFSKNKFVLNSYDKYLTEYNLLLAIIHMHMSHQNDKSVGPYQYNK